MNYGVRWDRQNPPVNLNNVYTRPGYAGVWGVSGIGNLFINMNRGTGILGFDVAKNAVAIG